MKNKVGIDIVKNERFNDLELIKKFLSEKELLVYEEKISSKQKNEYVAGRWAAKESLYKLLNFDCSFKEISILSNKNGSPYIETNFFDADKISISISHEDKYTIAIATFND